MTASAPPAPPQTVLPPLRGNRDFMTFWIGETASLLGTQVTNLALPLTAVLACHATDEQVGVLRSLQLLPYLGLALLFGVWADRRRRRPLMLAANAARMVLLLLVPVLVWAHALTLPVLLAVACGVGTASVLFDVSWMSYVPTLVGDRRHYVEASAKMSVSSSAAEVAGPGLAGVLIGALTAPVALLADAFSYTFSLISLLLIRTREPMPQPAADERHLWRELREGVAYVCGHPVLRPLALVAPLCNFSLVGVWTLFLLHGTRDLHLNPAALGTILAGASVGGLVGGALSRRAIAQFGPGTVYAVSMSAVFAGPLVAAFAHGPRPVVIALCTSSFFLSYLGLGVAGVLMVAVRQTCTPTAMMGRMTACFRTALFGGGCLGGLSAGLLAGRIGSGSALMWTAAGSAAAAGAVLCSPVSRLRVMPSPVANGD
ncbi:MFS transporter [Streptomyces griseoluteus]|uniref:MFS transporter n=1 Tax=Streptomyces griseoluteus TaxID=29306 RepID=UPI0037006A88